MSLSVTRQPLALATYNAAIIVFREDGTAEESRVTQFCYLYAKAGMLQAS